MNCLEEVIASISTERVFIQTHNFPDPDAIACAYGLSELLKAKGTACSYIAAGTAGAAISYGLGQGATMVAALWGGYLEGIQRGSKSTNLLIALMFVLFFLGLALIITSGGN